MIILGIDPGTASVGYALLKGDGRIKPELLSAGLLDVRSRENAQRMAEIHRALERIIKQWRPDRLSVEKLFFAKNTKTALAVSEGRGVILLTASLAGLTVYEYTPLEIKCAVSGDGRADKLQIQKMIRFIFPQYAGNARDDVFDAIAAALTCYFSANNNR